MRLMKRKFINGPNWGFLSSYSCNYIHIEDMFAGYISLIKVIKVKHKLTVDYAKTDTCLIDDGYKCLMFLPDNEKWCVSAIYDTSGEIVEWYFDMTKQNSIDEMGNPFYDDLYLDIAVPPDFQAVILDEDELKEALDLKIITESDYKMAYDTCNKILNEIIPDKDFMISFFNKYMLQLEQQ